QKFLVEPLEPRVLLSGDVLAEAVVLPLVDALPPLIQTFESESEIRTSSDNGSDSSASPTLPAIFEFAVVQEEQGSANETSGVDTGSNLASGGIAENSANSETSTTDGHDSVATQLTETLRVAHGPPGETANQLFYLDFEGTSGVSYDGPVRVDGI